MHQFPPVLCQGVVGDPASLVQLQLLLVPASLPHPDPTLAGSGCDYHSLFWWFSSSFEFFLLPVS